MHFDYFISKLGFDVAFGGYDDIDPKYGSIQATHITKTRIINNITGEAGV